MPGRHGGGWGVHRVQYMPEMHSLCESPGTVLLDMVKSVASGYDSCDILGSGVKWHQMESNGRD